jgi:hypothetical protein
MARFSGTSVTRAAFSLICCIAPIAAAHAQSDRAALIQIEVRDSIGLPLPDATVEVFTLLEGGVFWEWARAGAADLPEGINLLRFSHPGYEPSTFSVPLREGSVVSLRVRLMAARDSARRATSLDARELHVIGLAIEGRIKSDVIGHRRIVERSVVDQDQTHRFGNLMRRARNTELKVTPATAGSFRINAQNSIGRSNCSMLVMVNGDRRKVLPFATFDQLYGTQDLETIEVFPRGSSIPNSYQVTGSRCGLMVAWFKTL